MPNLYFTDMLYRFFERLCRSFVEKGLDVNTDLMWLIVLVLSTVSIFYHKFGLIFVFFSDKTQNA